MKSVYCTRDDNTKFVWLINQMKLVRTGTNIIFHADTFRDVSQDELALLEAAYLEEYDPTGEFDIHFVVRSNISLAE